MFGIRSSEDMFMWSTKAKTFLGICIALYYLLWYDFVLQKVDQKDKQNKQLCHADKVAVCCN